jgi:hypothetical protein
VQVAVADIKVRGITKTTASDSASEGRRRLAVDGVAIDYAIELLRAAAATVRAASASMAVRGPASRKSVLKFDSYFHRSA